ncbi:MAG: type III polyketide synthase [Chitinivibrionales bacterium]|nr:type III polyketide synthase [Chitinivibrionales bacterium]
MAARRLQSRKYGMIQSGAKRTDNGTGAVRIASIGTANPPVKVDQKQADRLYSRYYKNELTQRSMDVLHKVLAHPSIQSRYASVKSQVELLQFKNEDPDKRMDRYTYWAVELATKAIAGAVEKCGLHPVDIDALVTNTCTGYLCPGIGTYLIESLGLSPDTFVYDLAGSGCGGAVPNIQLSSNFVAANPGKVAVSASIEICSATYQMDNDIALIISNAIFGDGAAAAVIWDRPRGFMLIDTMSRFDPQYREDVRYVYKKGQLHNRISPRLPKVLGELVPPLIKELIAKNGLKTADISHWAIHPGGDKIVEILKEEMSLSEEQLAPTRSVLSEFGNMSSPTVLFEFDRIMNNGTVPGQWCVMVGFGAGLSIYAYLMKI